MAANVSVPNSFVNASASDADDVNANFAAIVSWINTNAVHLDASKAFTAIPSGPASDPTTANQFARKAYVDRAVPPGTVIDFAGSAVPDGFLICDGSAVSRSTYSSLFTAIGTLWGAGDGSTTFNLPDLRGRTSFGKLTADADFGTVGGTGGQKTVAAHVHAVVHSHTGTTGVGSAHTHSLGSHTHTGTTASGGSHQHTAKVKNVDMISAGAYSLARIESAASWYDSYQTITASGEGAHTHTFTTAAASGNTGSESAHTHTFTTDNYSGDTSSAGSGTTNLNPYATLLKAIKY